MPTRNLEQAPNRARLKYWQGTDPTGFEKGPDLLNNEALQALNAAGTALVDIVKVNASNSVEVAGKVAQTTELITFNIPAGNAAADYDGVRTIPYAWRLISAVERHQTPGNDAGAVTVMVKKVPSGTAKAAGTDMLATGLSLKGIADTVQTGAPHATPANYTGAAFDGIGLVTTGTLTNVDGVCIVVEIERL